MQDFHQPVTLISRNTVSPWCAEVLHSFLGQRRPTILSEKLTVKQSTAMLVVDEFRFFLLVMTQKIRTCFYFTFNESSYFYGTTFYDTWNELKFSVWNETWQRFCFTCHEWTIRKESMLVPCSFVHHYHPLWKCHIMRSSSFQISFLKFEFISCSIHGYHDYFFVL